MTGPVTEPDAQDQSEIFDETHIDDEGDGDLLLDEAGPVLDVTRAAGDSGYDDRPSGAERGDRERRLASEAFEAEADVLLGQTGRPRGDDEAEEPVAPGEIELVYTGLMRDVRGAQASAAHWEARRLSDDDIADLGYGPDAVDPDPDSDLSRTPS
tara:strand:- start:2318 stop:2782 length:465 start_codon:yes stop_codon:yes gene_type:complete